MSFCDIVGHPGTKRESLCLSDCIATHLQFCYNDWVLIEEKKLKGQFFKSRGSFRLPNCTALPRYNPKRRTCSYVGLTELDDSKVTCKLIELQ